jgi:hypothetical protein
VTRKAYGPYPECEERDQSKMIKTQATGPKQEPETGKSGDDTPRIRRVFAGSASTVVASVLRHPNRSQKPENPEMIRRVYAAPNRSFRRYILVFKEGVPMFERDPICKAFDEILEELFGYSTDGD